MTLIKPLVNEREGNLRRGGIGARVKVRKNDTHDRE
jgi:hypothetical protein